MNKQHIPSISLQQYTAPNSLRLLYAVQKSNPLVCLQLYIRSGSVHEEEHERGYAHFLEHLVFKATNRFPNNNLSYAAAEIGAVLNAFTDFDTTCFYLTLPAEFIETGLLILSEMAIHACFSTKDIELEKSVIIEEIHQYEAEPEMSFIEYVQTRYFDKSPLKYPVLGNASSLKKATQKSLFGFYKKHYRPDNAFLVATGDYDETMLKILFHKYFGEWNADRIPQINISSPLPHSFRVFNLAGKGRDLIAIAIPELNESHMDSEALHIAIRYMAIGKSSLLYKKLVEKEKLCSWVKVSSLSGLLPGASVILFAPVHTDFSTRIVEYFFTAWKQILEHGVPNEDLSLVRSDIVHNWLYSFEGVENLANLIAAEEFNGDLARIYNYGAYIESIDNNQLIFAVRTHWQFDRISVFLKSKIPKLVEIRSLCNKMRGTPIKPVKINRIIPKRESAISTDMVNHNTKSQFSSFHIYNLDNGLKVVYNYQPGKDICGFALSSAHSQLNEAKPGQNYFSSTLMLYGTQNRSHEEIMRFSRKHGFNIRVLHHLDSTLFRGKCYKEDLSAVMELLGEIIMYPNFDKSYLQILKNAAAESIRRERDYPVSVAYKTWFHQLLGAKNNLFSATGNISSIKAITLDDCEEWFNNYNLGEEFTLCVVGSCEPEYVSELSHRFFSMQNNHNPVKKHNLIYSTQEHRISKRYYKLDQSIIHVGGLACPANNREENSAFHVLAHILGGDLSSRIYNILREELAYAYQTGFDFSSINDLGFWYAYAFCDAKDHVSCLQSLLRILADVCKDGISKQELESAQNYLIATSRIDSESVSFKASSIANLISLGYDLDYYLNREHRIRQASTEMLRHLAEKYLNTQNQQIHVLV